MIINFEYTLSFMLILFRMTGMLVFNPILGRRNIPTMLNAGLAFVLALLLAGTVPTPILSTPTPSLLLMILWVFKEMLIGFICGIMLQMFISALIVGGEMVDMQMGMSMAKAFDPGTNASISATSQYYNILFTLVFFVSNGHLTFIQIITQSFAVLPLGSYILNPDAFLLIVQIFSNVLLLAAKLSIPIVVMETVVTFAVGIIMRIIPQINVFVVNIQFKLLVGLMLLLVLVPSFSAFMENLFAICVENIESVLIQLSGTV